MLTLPFLYPSLNEMLYRNPFQLQREHDDYQQKAAIYLKLQDPPTFGAGPVRIAINLHFKTERKTRRDIDNYSPKWLLDTLVKLRILEDDNSDIIPEPVKIRLIDRAPEECTELQIEKL